MSFDFNILVFSLIASSVFLLSARKRPVSHALWLLMAIGGGLSLFYLENFFYRLLLLDIAGLCLLLGDAKGCHRNVEAVSKMILCQVLGSLLLFVKLQSLSPSYLSDLVLLVAIMLKLGLFPFHRFWVDFVDGGTNMQTTWFLFVFRASLLTMLLEKSLVPNLPIGLLSMLALIYSSLIILGQSNMRRIQAYFSLYVFSLLMVIGLYMDLSLSMILVFSLFSLLPRVVLDENKDFIDLGTYFNSSNGTLKDFSGVLVISTPVFLSLTWIEQSAGLHDFRVVTCLTVVLLSSSAMGYRFLKARAIVQR